ncbi:MAG: hypothetical protein COB62_00150 [Piscirickettsiaceae bacterium]|nr:MAG: hypothetical protein COB62_00150 [Piscirickettsiaceae bacterium]
MNNETILKEEKISLTDTQLNVAAKSFVINEIESIYIGETNPAKERAYVFIAIGAVLTIFTSRWFMAGGVLAILAGIVTFFDSRRKYTIYIKTKKGDTAVTAGHDFKRIKAIKELLTKKTTLGEIV